MVLTATEKLQTIYNAHKTHWMVYLSPQVDKLPLAIQRHDDPFLPYIRAIQDAIGDLICGYIFDLGAYLALGGAGAVALERSIHHVRETHFVIVDAAVASAQYTGFWDDTAYRCDGITIADARVIDAYRTRTDRLPFLIQNGEVDGRTTPTWWPASNMWGVGTMRIRQLSNGFLEASRSLMFEETLRQNATKVINRV